MVGENEDDHVIKLSDFRTKNDRKDLCWVTFIGHKFVDGTKEHVLTRTVEVPDGDIDKLISSVRDAGGFYVEKLLETWFSPWPCAAVYVRWQNARGEITRIV